MRARGGTKGPQPDSNRALWFMVSILAPKLQGCPLLHLTLKPSLNTFDEILHPNSHGLKLVVTKIEADTRPHWNYHAETKQQLVLHMKHQKQSVNCRLLQNAT